MTDMNKSELRAWLQGPVREFLTNMPELGDLPALEGSKRGRMQLRLEIAKTGLRDLVYEIATACFDSDFDLAKEVSYPNLTPKGRLRQYSDGILRVLGLPVVQWEDDSENDDGGQGFVTKDWLTCIQAQQAAEALARAGIKASWSPDTEANGMAWLYAKAPEDPQ